MMIQNEQTMHTNGKVDTVFRMLHKLSFSMKNIPPLFVQLNVLEYNPAIGSVYWREKARLTAR